jgi:hypothetical protein
MNAIERSIYKRINEAHYLGLSVIIVIETMYKEALRKNSTKKAEILYNMLI